MAAWLPALICLPAYDGDWTRYVDAVYEAFRTDFVRRKPSLAGRQCGLCRSQLSEGKEDTFWHVVSEGENEHDRLPNLRRCERIRWPRPIIESAGSNGTHCWSTKRGREKRIVISLGDFSYLVVLVDRKTHVRLLTAFPIEREKRREKLRKECENNSKV